MKNYFTILLLSLFFASAVGQQSKIDSLKEAASSSKQDTTKAKLYMSVAKKYLYSNPDSMIYYLNIAKKHISSDNYSQKYQHNGLLGDFYIMYGNLDTAISILNGSFEIINEIKSAKTKTDYLAKTYASIARAFDFSGVTDSAIYYYKKAMDFQYQHTDLTDFYQTKHNLGLVYYQMGKFKESLTYFYSTHKFFESQKDTASMAYSLMAIGLAKNKMKQYSDGLKFLKKSNEYMLKSGNIAEHLNVMNSIAVCYLNLNDTINGVKYYEYALKKASEIGRNSTIGVVSLNLAEIKLNQKKFAEAQKLYEQALKIFKLEGWNSDIMFTYNGLAWVYYFTDELEKALECVNKSVEMNRAIQEKETLSTSYEILSNIYYAKNEFKKAHDFLRLRSDLYKSIMNEQIQKDMEELHVQYETEKKDLENKALVAKTELLQVRQNLTIIGFIAGIIILAMISFIIIRRKQRHAETKQRMASEHARDLFSDSIAYDLHDDVVSTLSFALNNIKANSKDQQVIEPDLQSIADVQNKIRTISHRLRKPNLDAVDYVAHINHTISTLNRGNYLQLVFESNISDWNIVPKPVQQQLLSISNTLIDNTIKYAEAKTAYIKVSVHKNKLKFYFEDDGKGFDKNILVQNKGIGLQGVEARTKALGGTVLLEPIVSKGFSATIEVPVLKKYINLPS